SYCLILWPFHEKLHLTVLICCAERGQGRRAHGSTVRSVLAETLGPELNEPCGKIAQWIRVRHENTDCLAEPRVGQPLQHRKCAGRISIQLWSGATIRHLRRAREKKRDVDADERGGQHADGSENAEPSAHVRRNV